MIVHVGSYIKRLFKVVSVFYKFARTTGNWNSKTKLIYGSIKEMKRR